ncbi:MAG: cobalamin biosynthesis protein, partial [Alphaproteobacteria bacterium]
MTKPPAVIVLGPSGLETGRKIVAALPGAKLHGRAERVPEADVSFDDVSDHLRRLFGAGTPIIAVAASGIVIRALASVLADKRSEPPVIAVAQDGSSVVPLLGGHHGANAMADRIAEDLQGYAALTTASDIAFGVALDDPPKGWTIGDPAHAKDVAAALLAGESVRVVIEAGDAEWLRGTGLTLRQAQGEADERGNLILILSKDEVLVGQGETPNRTIRITDRPTSIVGPDLVYIPPVLTLGVGCERGASFDSILALYHRALGECGLTHNAIACVVSLDLKASEPAIDEFAERAYRPFRVFSAAELEEETPRLANPSDVVFAEVGCHGVAEAAALRAAGPDAELVVPKIVGDRATIAIARSPRAIDPDRVGRAPGRLAVVGLGPGDYMARTRATDSALFRAEDVIGYQGYLELLGDSAAGRTLHPFALGEEETRCAHALALAAAGRSVVLVCSGDPGVYAMASLVLELQERAADPMWRRVTVEVVPGVSAMQTAAARAGAPLGHDFCAISLSDLMTPWDAIERRIEAAGHGDFVVAFYNPVSARRREGLAKAR